MRLVDRIQETIDVLSVKFRGFRLGYVVLTAADRTAFVTECVQFQTHGEFGTHHSGVPVVTGAHSHVGGDIDGRHIALDIHAVPR